MNAVVNILGHLSARLDRFAPMVVPSLARLVFAGVLLIYFWNSARTKIGDGLFGFLHPSDGAYIQIFPKAAEAAAGAGETPGDSDPASSDPSTEG